MKKSMHVQSCILFPGILPSFSKSTQMTDYIRNQVDFVNLLQNALGVIYHYFLVK